MPGLSHSPQSGLCARHRSCTGTAQEQPKQQKEQRKKQRRKQRQRERQEVIISLGSISFKVLFCVNISLAFVRSDFGKESHRVRKTK